ncbi:MAG: cell surface protein SprA, partial [Muribaculaceae bacterium]|nr:cell surface protein SprA [Muribaculaceae bacterium]
QMPVLDWLTANVNYNSTYQWDRGATIDGFSVGNTIANQGALTGDGRINFETVYNKVAYLKKINTRFSNRRGAAGRIRTPRKFERTLRLNPDTTTVIRHNLRTRNVKVVAQTAEGTPFIVKTRPVDENSIEVLTRSGDNLRFTITEIIKDNKKLGDEILAYATRLLMSPRSAAVRFRSTHTTSIPLYRPEVGDMFGQSGRFGPLAPGLDFAFGFTGEDFVEKIKERGWLMTDDGQTSPALFSRTKELNVELTLEPIKGLRIVLTTNRTDNRTNQIQFMYDNMPVTRTGTYTKTHCALATALRGSNAKNGYYNKAFQQFLDNIPVVAERVQSQYYGAHYPTGGFMHNNANAGLLFNPEVGGVSATSSDVLIPAFIAAYTGRNASSQYLDPFPSFAEVLPNWRITYDGLINLGNMRNIFKAFTLNHAYQCTYSVGSYSSYLNWLSADGSERLGFTLDELTGQPIPSSPYNISSVSITERFAPLIGATATLKNDLKINAEYRDSRTLTLNSSAGQVVEANSRTLTIGAGYKIVGFNTVLKMRGSQQGFSNDLTVNADFAYTQSQALIRRIESNYTQPTSGTRTITMNITAAYALSRRLMVTAFFDHQINTPLVSASAYPTTNSSYGLTFNLSLAR